MVQSPTVIVDQNETGYRYSSEPFLLADFANPEPGARVLDIGTGCGVIALLMLARQPGMRVTGVEIQETLYSRAQSNRKLNGLENCLHLVHEDAVFWAEKFKGEAFDWVVCNPPYREINSGRLNPDPEKAIARHEIHLSLETLLTVAGKVLKPSGKLTLVYPMRRKNGVLASLAANGFSPVKIRRVFGHQNSGPRFFLVTSRKGSDKSSPEEDDFFMYHPDGSYTRNMQVLYESFNYSGRSHRQR